MHFAGLVAAIDSDTGLLYGKHDSMREDVRGIPFVASEKSCVHEWVILMLGDLSITPVYLYFWEVSVPKLKFLLIHMLINGLHMKYFFHQWKQRL